MGYKKFERAMTTVLATVPSKDELESLLKKLDEYKQVEKAPEAGDDEDTDSEKLKVIKISELKEMLLDMGLIDASTTIEKLPNSSQYDSYSYPIELLREFSTKGGNAAASGAKSSDVAASGGISAAASAAANAGPAGGAKNNRRQARFSMMAPPSQSSAPPKRGLGASGISTRF